MVLGMEVAKRTRFWFLIYFCIPRQPHISWCARDGSRWTSLPGGFRFSGEARPEGVNGRWRQSKSAKGAPQVGPRSRINPNVAREMAHTKVSRLEKALEAMGDLQGPVVEVLKADLAKVRAASKKPSVEVEIDECRKFISRAERRIRELDTEREKEHVSLLEAPERLERLVDEQSRCPETHDILSGTQVTALQQMVNLLQSERDAGVDGGQVGCVGGTDHSPCSEETSGFTASIVAWRRTRSDSVDALPRAERCDKLVGGSTSGFPRGIGARRFEKSSRIVQDVVRRSPSFGGDVSTPAIICGQHGDVNCEGDHCFHQCGYLGCRVGEASNPGPVQTRQARRAEHDQLMARGYHTQVDVSSDRRVVPRVTGTISEDDEPLVPPCVQDTAQDSVRVDVSATCSHGLGTVTRSQTDQCRRARPGGRRGHFQSHKWTHLRTKSFFSTPTV